MSDEEFEIVRCERRDDGKYLCEYEGEKFEVDVDSRDEIELKIHKDLLKDYDVKTIVKMMLTPANRSD